MTRRPGAAAVKKANADWKVSREASAGGCGSDPLLAGAGEASAAAGALPRALPPRRTRLLGGAGNAAGGAGGTPPPRQQGEGPGRAAGILGASSGNFYCQNATFGLMFLTVFYRPGGGSHFRLISFRLCG